MNKELLENKTGRILGLMTQGERLEFETAAKLEGARTEWYGKQTYNSAPNWVRSGGPFNETLAYRVLVPESPRFRWYSAEFTKDYRELLKVDYSAGPAGGLVVERYEKARSVHDRNDAFRTVVHERLLDSGWTEITVNAFLMSLSSPIYRDLAIKQSCVNCGNGPRASGKCLTKGCSWEEGRPHHFANWIPLSNTSVRKPKTPVFKYYVTKDDPNVLAMTKDGYVVERYSHGVKHESSIGKDQLLLEKWHEINERDYGMYVSWDITCAEVLTAQAAAAQATTSRPSLETRLDCIERDLSDLRTTVMRGRCCG